MGNYKIKFKAQDHKYNYDFTYELLQHYRSDSNIHSIRVEEYTDVKISWFTTDSLGQTVEVVLDIVEQDSESEDQFIVEKLVDDIAYGDFDDTELRIFDEYGIEIDNEQQASTGQSVLDWV